MRKKSAPLRAACQQELEEASNAMGYGAVKYADLKNQRLTNYKFNFDQMLNLTGNTAVYLLYAHARIAGIIRKSSKDINGGCLTQACCWLGLQTHHTCN
jgi:arginyl-tRNA synthetase